MYALAAAFLLEGSLGMWEVQIKYSREKRKACEETVGGPDGLLMPAWVCLHLDVNPNSITLGYQAGMA